MRELCAHRWPIIWILPIVLMALASSALAHDYWIMPADFVVPEGRDIDVSLVVGDHFVAEDERPFERARFSKLAHVSAGGTVDLLDAATEGARPMMRLSAPEAGGHLIVVDRDPARIELEPRKFEDYLSHEGLGGVVEARARLGETEKPGRERYSRCLKSLVQVGDARDDAFAAVIGQTLEIVPQRAPTFTAPGSTLPVAVRFRGAPLPNVQLTALSRRGADVRAAVYTTDAEGVAHVDIDRRGVWLLRLVHMVRCEACDDADWESFWASYSFAIPDSTGARPGWLLALLAAAGGLLVSGLLLARRRRRRSR